jgi:hypothetical protein
MKLLVSLSFILICGSCLERLDVPTIKKEPSVVVDGMITNEPGPYTVKLSWSSSTNESLEYPLPIRGAIVSISDDIGNVEVLTEGDGGSYKTSAIQGEIGREYKLSITTLEGVTYESIPAVLQPAGQIENLYFEYKKNIINPDNPLLPQNALVLLVDGKGEEGYANLFRWRWRGVFHITTFPMLRTRLENVDGIWVPVPFPEPCSGFIYDGIELLYQSPCTCCDCWITQKGIKVSLSNNTVSNGIDFRRVQLTTIPIDKWLFDDKYYFVAEQISIQPEVYDFWKLVSAQQQTAENIFQPNVVSVKGNMRCISHPEKKVHGIFSVSSITRKSFFINRSDIPQPIPIHDMGVTDCADFFDNATYKTPTYW